MTVVRAILRCSQCPAQWHQMTDNHSAAVRRAVIAGWTTTDPAGGCLCACRDVRCPEHPA